MGKTDMLNVLLAISAIERLAALVERALQAGEDITDEQIDAAFRRADAAEKKWEEAGKG